MDVISRRRQLMGMQKKEELPSLYYRVEYLESSGTQYIYTDIPCRSGIECEAVVEWVSGGANDASIFGGRLATSNRLLLIHQYPQQKWTLGYGSSNTNLAAFAYGTKYQVQAKTIAGNQLLIIDGQTIYSGSSASEYSNSFNMSLFACTYGSANAARLFASARVYSLSVKVDGQKAANYIPCIRKADGKPGMYDTISKTFYTNAGTGEFITPTVYNLCPAATGTEIAEKWGLSNSYRRYILTGLDPNQDYTLQATWTRTWDTFANRRLYLNGITTNTMIRPTSQDTVAPFTKFVTTKPSADGTLEIAANNAGLTSASIDGPEYAASMINIMLEAGSVAHPFVPYIEP